MTIGQWLAAFVGIIWIRIFLEGFSSPSMTGYFQTDIYALTHYTIFFFAAVLTSIVVIGGLLRLPIVPMTRAVIFILPILWLPPLIDLTYGGAQMTYLYTPSFRALFIDYATYFGPLTDGGATLGLRIEIAILIVLFGGYVYLHTKSVAKALTGAWLQYTLVFLFGSLPSLVAILVPSNNFFSEIQRSLIPRSFSHPSEMYTAYRTFELLFDATLSKMLYLLLAGASVLWVRLAYPGIFRAMVRNLRTERILHYLVMFVLGVLVALSSGAVIAWSFFDVITFAVALCSMVAACVFAIVTNDLVDEQIDRVSNPERPLATGAITRGAMQEAALIALLLTLFGGLALSTYALFWLSIFTAAYYVYSVPPLRLKRIPIFSSFFVGIASASFMLLGFYIVSFDQTLAAFPGRLVFLLIASMTLLTNVRDLKDIEGDREAGINTLPVLLGDRRARRVMGILSCGAYILVPLCIPVSNLWIPSLIAGALSWHVLEQGRTERAIFSVYFAYLAVLVTVLYFMG